MRLLRGAHSNSQHVCMLGALDGVAGRPPLGTFDDIWQRRTDELPSLCLGPLKFGGAADFGAPRANFWRGQMVFHTERPPRGGLSEIQSGLFLRRLQ